MVINKTAYHTGIPIDLFDFIFTEDKLEHHKPDPRVFEPAFKKCNGTPKSRIGYAGDTPIDYQAITSFGGQFIAVCTGPFNRKDFLDIGVPDHLILQSPAEITSIIMPSE